MGEMYSDSQHLHVRVSELEGAVLKLKEVHPILKNQLQEFQEDREGEFKELLALSERKRKKELRKLDKTCTSLLELYWSQNKVLEKLVAHDRHQDEIQEKLVSYATKLETHIKNRIDGNAQNDSMLESKFESLAEEISLARNFSPEETELEGSNGSLDSSSEGKVMHSYKMVYQFSLTTFTHQAACLYRSFLFNCFYSTQGRSAGKARKDREDVQLLC